MTKKEFEEYLISIDGLENGYFTDRPPITERYFFSVGDGWLHLIKELIEQAVKLGWDKQICQVKEKFGGLRFYINSAPNGVHNLIQKAESASYSICESCGTTKNIGQTKGWISTVCNSCHKKEHPDRIWNINENKYDTQDNTEFKNLFD